MQEKSEYADVSPILVILSGQCDSTSYVIIMQTTTIPADDYAEAILEFLELSPDSEFAIVTLCVTEGACGPFSIRTAPIPSECK